MPNLPTPLTISRINIFMRTLPAMQRSFPSYKGLDRDKSLPADIARFIVKCELMQMFPGEDVTSLTVAIETWKETHDATSGR